MDDPCRPVHLFSDEQVNIVDFLHYYFKMNHASKRYNHKSPNIIYGISQVRSDGNPTVKIEGGGGQQSYLYTVKIGNFRQILMSSLLIY